MKASSIAAFLNEPLSGLDFEIRGLAALDQLSPGHMTFSKSGDVPPDMGSVAPVLVLVPSGRSDGVGEGCASIRVSNPRNAFARVAAAFFSEDPPLPGIHQSAVVAATAKIDGLATIGPNCVVGSRCRVGPRTVLTSGVNLGADTIIGANCSVGPNTSIGHSGFGFAEDVAGRPFRMPQLGGVHIGDNVELGALNTVCAGTLRATTLDEYVKTDDHVHIAHNVQVGENTLIASHASIAGSVVVEGACWIAPNATVLNGLHIGTGATIGMGATVMRDVPAGHTVMGTPARRVPAPPPTDSNG